MKSKITDIYIYSGWIEVWRTTRPFLRTYPGNWRNVQRVMRACQLYAHTGRVGNTVRHYKPHQYDHES